MKEINDLQAGKAGEYLVCADLIINGYVAFPSEQGLPYDVILEYENRLYKMQVKTTRKPKSIAGRKNDIPAYVFHIGNNGKGNKRKKYNESQVDVFALVCLETKEIAYLPYSATKSTMNFRVPSLRGTYRDEQGEKNKMLVTQLKKEGMSCAEIAKQIGLKLSSVYLYSADVSIEQKGTNSGTYFDQYPLEKCLNQLAKSI